MKLTDLKVGDKITVRSPSMTPEVRMIVRALKTKIVDSSGTEWTRSGRRYGCGLMSVCDPYAEPWYPEDDEAIAQAKAEREAKDRRGRVVSFYNWDATQEQVDAAHKIVVESHQKNARYT